MPSAAVSSRSIAVRLAGLVRGAIRAVTSRVFKAAASLPVSSHCRVTAPDRSADIWVRAQCDRILALADRIRADRAHRMAAGLPAATDTGARLRRATPAKWHPRRSRGWLIREVPQTAVHAGDVALLLEETDLREMCLSTPEMRFLVLPLLWALDLSRPAWMPTSPRVRSARAVTETEPRDAEPAETELGETESAEASPERERAPCHPDTAASTGSDRPPLQHDAIASASGIGRMPVNSRPPPAPRAKPDLAQPRSHADIVTISKQ